MACQTRRDIELIVLFAPWSLQRHYVWVEICAAWIWGIPIILVRLGLTPKGFRAQPNAPMSALERGRCPNGSLERVPAKSTGTAQLKGVRRSSEYCDKAITRHSAQPAPVSCIKCLVGTPEPSEQVLMLVIEIQCEGSLPTHTE